MTVHRAGQTFMGTPVVVDDNLPVPGIILPSGYLLHDHEHLSPDCAVDKHGACVGDAWCVDADLLTDCDCACHPAAAEECRDEWCCDYCAQLSELA